MGQNGELNFYLLYDSNKCPPKKVSLCPPSNSWKLNMQQQCCSLSDITFDMFCLCRLRTLSSQGGSTGPPSPTKPLQTPSTPTANLAKKFKLAEFRYGKEELLQLYVESPELPANMASSVSHICKESPSGPLAFLPLSEEEQVSTNAATLPSCRVC